jgi:hypothetical protein
MAQRTNAQIIKAIKDSRGLIAVAARKLGVSRRTIYNRMEKSEEIREALDEARDFVLDVGQAKLYQAVEQGESWAVQYLLNTLGKSRGFTTRQEVTGRDGGPIQHEDVTDTRDKIAKKLDAVGGRIGALASNGKGSPNGNGAHG